MTFEGNRYRLVDLVQADLVDGNAFRQVGTTSEADIEFAGTLDVYERTGDPEAVYTYSKATGTGEASTPALWLRWTPAD